MSCSNIPTNVQLQLDNEDNFISFNFAKIACKCENNMPNRLTDYYKGKSLREIFSLNLADAYSDLNIVDEEDEFIFRLERDALKAAISNYIGIDDDNIDKERCQITSIDHDEEGGTTIQMIILPPKS